MALNSTVHVRELKKKKGKYKWLATFKEGGRIKKKYFVLKKKAEAFQEDQEKIAKEHGTEVFVTAAERAVIAETREALGGAGLSLREAVELALDRSAKLKKSGTIAELFASLTREKEREGASPDYLTDIKSRLGKFTKAFGNRNAAGFEPQEISDWLVGLGVAPTTQANYR
ncbi:MAG: hypothetical protein ACI9NC_004552, partial [Verrucomicrobiales bacterium]